MLVAPYPSTPCDPASGVAALRAAVLADFGGDVVWCYGAQVEWACGGRGDQERPTLATQFSLTLVFPPNPLHPALPGATYAHAAGAVCSTPPAWGLAPDDDGLVVVNLVPPCAGDPAPALATVGLLPPGTAALPPFTTPPPPPIQATDGSPLPPVLGLEPLVGAVTCPTSGRAWLLRRRARRTLGDALRFGGGGLGGAPFFSPLAARLVLFQVAAAVAAAARAGLPPPAITPDDVLMGDGCARASVAPAALFRPAATTSLPSWAAGGVADATDDWSAGSLSTLDYLLRLQVLAGRRWADPRAHPFLPWVLRDLAEGPPPASAPSAPPATPPAPWVRDLTRTQWRLVKGDAQLDASFEAAASPGDAHHVPAASPLGELGFCVALARSLPRATLTSRVRRGWQPREYPASLARLAAWTADEAVPELYVGDGAAVLVSTHPDLPDLALPAWAPDAAAFLAAHRAALESATVTASLPAWIDLTFGVALAGPAAIAAKNTAPPRQPGAGLPGVGRCQLFSAPHPPRRPGVDGPPAEAGGEPTPVAPWDDGLGAPGGTAALVRLAVLMATGQLAHLAPGDEAGWAAAAAALADPEVASFAAACLRGEAPNPYFTTAVRAAADALLQQADAEAAARAAGAGAGVAAAAGLAAAAGGRASALTSAPLEAWTLAYPALLAALGRAFAGAAHAGCSSTDTAGANAAAAALGVLLGRAPWGVLSADAIPTVGRLLAAGSAVVAAGVGGGQQQQQQQAALVPSSDDPAPHRDRAPTMLAALLSRPCVGAVLGAGGLDPYLAHVHAHALDCLLLAGIKDSGGGGSVAAGAAAEAMGAVAARLPLPATLEWVVRPLMLALGSGASGPAAAGLVSVAKAVGGAAAGRHLLPPLVSVLASRITRTPPANGGHAAARLPPFLPTAGAVVVLEGIVPLLNRAGAGSLVAPRPAPDGRLAPAGLVGPLLDPSSYAPLDPGVRLRLGKALVAAADVAAGGGPDLAGPTTPFARDLLPQLLALFRVPLPARTAFGTDDKGGGVRGDLAPVPASDLASRLAEAMAGGVDGVGAANGGGAPPSPARPPPPSADSGWWRLAATLYAAAVARVPAPSLRTLVPGWVALEQGVPRAVAGWAQPPLDPPCPADAALAAEVGRAADRLAGRPGGVGVSPATHRRATVEEGDLPPLAPPSEAEAAARAAALISGAGWSLPSTAPAGEAAGAERGGSRGAPAAPPPDAAPDGRWAWLPPGLASPTLALGSSTDHPPGWGAPATWAAGPPRSSAALLGLAAGSSPGPPAHADQRLVPPPWAVQARPLHAWRAHRDRLRAVAVDDGEALVVTAGKAGPRRGGDSVTPAGAKQAGCDTARVWALADGRAGGEYGGHTARLTALALAAGPAPAVASLDAGGALHVWPSADPGGGRGWVVGHLGGQDRPPLVVVEAGGSPPPAAPRTQLPDYTCVVRAGGGGLGGACFVAGSADGRVGAVDAGAQAVLAATPPGGLWGGGHAVSALHAPPGSTWTAAGSAAGHVAVLDGRCGPGAAVVASWEAGGAGVSLTALLASPPLLATAGADRVVRVWDLRACGRGGGTSPPPLLHAWAPLKAAPTALVPAPGGGALAVAGPALAALPPLSSAAAFPPALPSVRAAPPRTAVAGLALLPWSRLLVLGCDDGHVLVCK